MPDQPTPNTTTTSANTPEDTSTSNGGGKIDFVDTIIFTSTAIGIDALGMIPVVGEVMSPVGIIGFRLLFWLKGVGGKSPVNNILSAGMGGSELIPFVSEVLPGCTAYVLTMCLTEQFAGEIGQVAGQVAKVAPAPQVKLAAGAIAAAAEMQQGKSAGEAVAGQVSSVAGGGVAAGAGQSAAGASSPSGASSSSGSGSQPGGAPSVSVGGGDYQGQASFELSGGPAGGASNTSSSAGGSVNGQQSPYAQGSPLVEGGPSAQPKDASANQSGGKGKMAHGFVEMRRKQIEEERARRRRVA